jgi:hypothetical protein
VKPCTLVDKYHEIFREAALCLSSVKMEAVVYYETLLTVDQSTRRHVPEDSNIHRHKDDDRKYHVARFVKERCFWEGSESWPVCPSGKSNI